ncbi:MAG: hypothetical protein O2930_00080 [Acidobacteria bacterium]|nr:hypothetical protein [Acidobacteriota bacterium]
MNGAVASGINQRALRAAAPFSISLESGGALSARDAGDGHHGLIVVTEGE